ncbi:tRNA threonylcarbamoyladenosine biosynthesis protein TsaE [Maioricimonas rarisocia]|uniref:tRNA threonylcarbamoyladenosine biosynthesis protein TsaE n=1 Tax=Maioricimonas rarisocia TaxID=2528026 RepID=A0A517Z608_9PLAN|nr:tRNA (adenosine(37)-N6)-threonylcarbamoyltransferase complex ATPase subunit type 1 TsaE [Maioricimonas rarisocia]QDU37859.1 tRNA threonylcarbamoyladenosine biosynthesis protein TsaE [Maioricimonas rarisocia]
MPSETPFPGVRYEFPSASESETYRFGAALARVLQPGDVVCLNGRLGAGKTRLVQAVAAAMGNDSQPVTSPTFTLIHEYVGDVDLFHVDAYRLRDSDEFLELGGEEILAAGGICLIEWANRIDDVLPRDALHITLDVLGENVREISVSATTGKAAGRVERLRQILEESAQSSGDSASD